MSIKKIDMFDLAIEELEDSCKVPQHTVVQFYIIYAVLGFIYGVLFMSPVIFTAVIFKIVKTGFIWLIGG